MRHLVLLASLTLAAAACQDTTGMDDARLAASRRPRSTRPAGGPRLPHRRRERPLQRHRGERRRLRPRRRVQQQRPAALAPSGHDRGPRRRHQFPRQRPERPVRAELGGDRRRCVQRRLPGLHLGPGQLHHRSRHRRHAQAELFPHLLAAHRERRLEDRRLRPEPGRPPAAAAARGLRHARAEARPPRSLPPASRRCASELRATDAAFSEASVADGTGPAFERYAAPNGDRGRRGVRLRSGRDRGGVLQRPRRRGELGAPLRGRRIERRPGLHRRRCGVRPRRHPAPSTPSTSPCGGSRTRATGGSWRTSATAGRRRQPPEPLTVL